MCRYGATKWASEVQLQQLHERWGVPVSIFRCGMILAHSRRALCRLTVRGALRILPGGACVLVCRTIGEPKPSRCPKQSAMRVAVKAVSDAQPIVCKGTNHKRMRRRYTGQINQTDFFTRLLAGICYTGLAPASFYRDPSGPDRHFDGMWATPSLHHRSIAL